MAGLIQVGKTEKRGLRRGSGGSNLIQPPADTVYSDRDIIQAYETSLPITIAQWQNISLTSGKSLLALNKLACSFNPGFSPPSMLF